MRLFSPSLRAGLFSPFFLYQSIATTISVLWGGCEFMEANLNDNYLGLSGRRLSSFSPLLCGLSSLMWAGLDKLFFSFSILGTL